MPDRSSKRPRDLNQLAQRFVREATGEAPPMESAQTEPEKDPAAVALDDAVD